MPDNDEGATVTTPLHDCCVVVVHGCNVNYMVTNNGSLFTVPQDGIGFVRDPPQTPPSFSQQNLHAAGNPLLSIVKQP